MAYTPPGRRSRCDATYLFLVEQRTASDDGDLSEPKGFYHKSCYASYTSKRNLEQVRSRVGNAVPVKGPHSEIGDAAVEICAKDSGDQFQGTS